MHNAQPSAAPLIKGHILRSCVLLICLVGYAQGSAASDGKQLHVKLFHSRFWHLVQFLALVSGLLPES